MCLYAIGGIKTAKEDMTVYKIIGGKNKSVHRHFKYTPNTMYRLRKKLVIKRNYDSRLVFHGFHAFLYSSSGCTRYGDKRVEFTIPKGAKYVLGKYSEIVSTSIRSGSLTAMRE